MRCAVVLISAAFLCASELPASELPVDTLIDASPAARQAFWGVMVADAETGEVLYSRNEDKFFVPASNTKLFTTSLALRRLGADYRFQTRVRVNAKPDSGGRVRELRLLGGADPNLSSRLVPYNKEESGPDPLAALRSLADQVVAAGVRVVEGDIVGDDTAFEWEPFPSGWGIDDPTWEYGAPVSALTLNDNAFRIDVFPGAAAGMPASLALSPPVEYLTVQNRTNTVETGRAKIVFDRIPGSRELVVSGTIRTGAASSSASLAIDDPALFAAHAFRKLLEDRGVTVTGSARALHRESGDLTPEWTGVELALHSSAPLSEIVQIINKVSQNLHTELVLRTVAREAKGVGSRSAGLAIMADYLKEIGVGEGQFNFEDASGLSRLTLVTPATVTKVLLSMYKTPERELWIGSLPVGGVDGTLENRFSKLPLASRIHAKTGSLSHVSALSGYALREDGRTLAFSIFVNNYNASPSAIRAVMDSIALSFLQ